MVWGIAWSWSALAQPTEEQPVVARIGLVLVSTFQPSGPETAPDAERLSEAVARRVAQSHPVLPMSHVPLFETQGYAADVYMLGCPPGHYAGCGLVVGQRADADWVLGATVRRDPDEFDPNETVLVMTVHVVDVRGANEVASFGLIVDPAREEDAVDGVGGVLDELLRSDLTTLDLRDTTDPVAVARAAAHREFVTASLATLERRLGVPIRPAPPVPIEPEKITRDDTAEYDQRDDTPPWVRAGLSERAWIRFSNSGDDLETWRADGNGRFTKILLRGSVGYGRGPWSERYEGQVLLSDQDLQPVDAAQLLEVTGAGSIAGDVEVGFGVAPVLDLAVTLGARSGSTEYSVDEQVQNRPAIRPPSATTLSTGTWQYGVRAQLAPFPRWPARPTLGIGVARWSGAGTPATDRFPALEAPVAWLVEVLPGAEVDLDGTFALTARAVYARPVVAAMVRETRSGDPLLSDPPAASGPAPAGVAFQVGVLVRVGPWASPSPDRR